MAYPVSLTMLCRISLFHFTLLFNYDGNNIQLITSTICAAEPILSLIQDILKDIFLLGLQLCFLVEHASVFTAAIFTEIQAASIIFVMPAAYSSASHLQNSWKNHLLITYFMTNSTTVVLRPPRSSTLWNQEDIFQYPFRTTKLKMLESFTHVYVSPTLVCWTSVTPLHASYFSSPLYLSLHSGDILHHLIPECCNTSWLNFEKFFCILSAVTSISIASNNN